MLLSLQSVVAKIPFTDNKLFLAVGFGQLTVVVVVGWTDVVVVVGNTGVVVVGLTDVVVVDSTVLVVVEIVSSRSTPLHSEEHIHYSD